MADYTEHFFTNSSGLQQYYRDYGSPADGAPVMLCLPGLTRNSRDFDAPAAQMSRAFRVIAVDQRGRGKSDYDPDPARYLPITYMQDMFALMETLGTDSIHAFGTSLGGLMTMLMAATKPGSIASAIINDIGPTIDPRGIDRIRSYVGAFKEIQTWDDAIAQTKWIADGVYPDFSEDDWDRFTRKIFVERGGKPVLDYDPALGDTFKSADDSQAAPDLWPLFDAMKPVPMLVIRGETSDILSQDTYEQMLDVHPDSSGVLVPRVGHAPTLDEPQVVSALDAWAARFGVAAP